MKTCYSASHNSFFKKYVYMTNADQLDIHQYLILGNCMCMCVEGGVVQTVLD